MHYKREEIVEYLEDFLKDCLEYDKDYLKDNDKSDIHHEAFNTDYYIIGTYKAKEWLGEEVFEVIEQIKEYENMHFGEVNTDFSNPERIVNMYVYIVGEDLIYNHLEDLDLKEVA